ncbi:hypothetical protein [Indiicoccus explosivorum]|uniref:hypothetical protein n=1 Tax=Indiicoccus explosivorum TaxID=1917864 RepID=UPI0012D81D74|nr:hypothetical protein [Indiicoccus explosivorum]
MYWYDVLITFVLSIVIFLLIGLAASVILKVTSRKHKMGIAFAAVLFALLAAFLFTI